MHFHTYNMLTNQKTSENFDRVCHVIPVGKVETMPRCEETISMDALQNLETPR